MRFNPRVLAITFPPFDVLNTRAAELRTQGHRVISLGQALPWFGPPASAVSAARANLDAEDVHVYSADAGRLSLRSSLSQRLRETVGIDSTPEDFIITAGGNQAFSIALATIAGTGDEVVLPSPYFVNHEMAVSAAGAVAVEAPVSDRATFSVRWEDIRPRLTPRTKAVVLCNPSNPTGATIGAREGTHIIAQLARRQIAVLSDETYMHFVYDRAHWSAAAVAGWRDNVVVLGTFSKSFGMTGWRVGYMLADAGVCEQALKIQDAMIICAPVASQVVAEAAVRNCWSYPITFHPELQRRRAVLIDELRTVPALEWTPTDGGFFAFVRVGGCEDSAALSQALLEQAHVVTIPGAIFGRSGEGCIRLSYGSVAVADLVDALGRLREFFSRWSPGPRPSQSVRVEAKPPAPHAQ